LIRIGLRVVAGGAMVELSTVAVRADCALPVFAEHPWHVPS
jgi:hypothetical protein